MLVYIASIDPEPLAGIFFKLTRPTAQWLIKIIEIFWQKTPLQKVVFLLNQWINYNKTLTAASS